MWSRRAEPDLRPGEVVRYVGKPVSGQTIDADDLGVVHQVGPDWVQADWPSGRYRVPLRSVRKVLAL
jgi:hypothetical protein